jgi:CheY-like chemotaxis protein
MILIVEDSEDDILLLRRALRNLGLSDEPNVVRSGGQAIEYLGGEKKFADREEFPLPRLILLDLKMPGIDGFEVLKWLREEPPLNQIPVVVMTGSTYSPDIRRAYQLGAKTFIVKPEDPWEYERALKQVTDYWLSTRAAPERQITVERTARQEQERRRLAHAGAWAAD